jgi:HD domain
MTGPRPPRVVLTARYDEALAYARQLHRGQRRKGAGTPYVSHLLSVSAMVLEMDGDEDAAIAALLHDAVEDQEATFAGIELNFGPVVREIVELATDSAELPGTGWTARKVAYLRRLDEKADDAFRFGGYLRVTLADKLHNARSIRADMWNDGDDRVFDLFRGAGVDREERRLRTLAYYADAVRILERVALASSGFRWYRSELTRVVTEIGGTGADLPALTLLG